MIKNLPVLLLLVSLSFAGNATQTDWSSGGGVPGPVDDWGTSYEISNEIDISGASLKLTYGPFANPVTHYVNNSGFFFWSERCLR